MVAETDESSDSHRSPTDDMQVDHLIPLHLANQYPSINLDEFGNYMPACRSCNHYKSTLTLDKFRAAIERWTETLKRDSVYCNAVRFRQVKPTPHPVVFYFERMNGAENRSDDVEAGK